MILSYILKNRYFKQTQIKSRLQDPTPPSSRHYSHSGRTPTLSGECNSSPSPSSTSRSGRSWLFEEPEDGDDRESRLRLEEGQLGDAHKTAGWRQMFAFWARWANPWSWSYYWFWSLSWPWSWSLSLSLWASSLIIFERLWTVQRRDVDFTRSQQQLRSSSSFSALLSTKEEAPHRLTLSRGEVDQWNPRSTTFWAFLPPQVGLVLLCIGHPLRLFRAEKLWRWTAWQSQHFV